MTSCRSAALQHSEVFEGTEPDSLLAEESQQGRIAENTKFMLSVVRLGKVIWALSTSSLVGPAGIPRVDHELCRERRQLRAWMAGGGGQLLSSHSVPQSSLEVGDGHVLAHGGQAQVHVGPPADADRVSQPSL